MEVQEMYQCILMAQQENMKKLLETININILSLNNDNTTSKS
jgi:hypothetical protein